jgi:hypothetical protein
MAGDVSPVAMFFVGISVICIGICLYVLQKGFSRALNIEKVIVRTLFGAHKDKYRYK